MTFWHQHKWEVVATNRNPSIWVTAILSRCECGRVEERVLTGYWTLEQVRREKS